MPSLIVADLSKKESTSLGLFSSVLGHVGDGNFHQAVMYDPQNPEHIRGVQQCVDKMIERAVEMEGTVSVSIVQLNVVVCFADAIFQGRTCDRIRKEGQ